RSLPRDRQREEERVEPCVVEALADVPAGREDESLLAVGNRGELLLCPTPLPGAHAAVEHDQIPRELLQLAAEVFEMVLPLGEEDRRAALVECLDDIVEDEPVTLFVCH